MIVEAVLFIPPGEHRIWIDVLAKYAADRGYTIVAVVGDFGEAVAMWSAKRGRKLIVARLDQTKDLEIVTANPAEVRPSQRRPQRTTAPSPGQRRPQWTTPAAERGGQPRPHLRAVA